MLSALEQPVAQRDGRERVEPQLDQRRAIHLALAREVRKGLPDSPEDCVVHRRPIRAVALRCKS
eukprot:6829329-Prymnesium_polylepis.1